MDFQNNKYEKLPISIISGFLGSGKTTLINNLLSELKNKKIAIVENEFGSLGIDSSLIKKNDSDGIYELNNGCICCTKNGELEGVLKEISENKKNYDYVIIETTGVASLSPIVSNFFSNPILVENFQIDSITTIVDCKNFFLHLESEVETKNQIAFADKILINKIDLVESFELKKIKEKVEIINPTATLLECINSNVGVADVLYQEKFNVEKIEEINNKFSNFSFTNISSSIMLGESSKGHLSGISNFSIISSKQISVDKVNFFINILLEHFGKDIFRIKGIFNIENSKNKLFFQGVHNDLEWMPGSLWKDNEKRETRIIFIGKNLDSYDIAKAFNDLVENEN